MNALRVARSLVVANWATGLVITRPERPLPAARKDTPLTARPIHPRPPRAGEIAP